MPELSQSSFNVLVGGLIVVDRIAIKIFHPVTGEHLLVSCIMTAIIYEVMQGNTCAFSRENCTAQYRPINGVWLLIIIEIDGTQHFVIADCLVKIDVGS